MQNEPLVINQRNAKQEDYQRIRFVAVARFFQKNWKRVDRLKK